MNSQLEELATLYVLDRLDAPERAAFEARLLREPALAALVRELESTLAHSIHALPPALPPPDLLARIEQRLDSASASSPRRSVSALRPPARFPLFARWGLAAVIALSLATLAIQSLRRPASPQIVFVTLAPESSTLARLPLPANSGDDPDARFIQLASLAEHLWEKPDQLPGRHPATTAPANRAYALFDPASAQGFIAIEQLPTLAPAERYHLWMIDASSGEIRDAGILPLAGTTRGLYSFSLASRSSGKPAQFKFLVTAENAPSPARPSGKVVLGGERL